MSDLSRECPACEAFDEARERNVSENVLKLFIDAEVRSERAERRATQLEAALESIGDTLERVREGGEL